MAQPSTVRRKSRFWLFFPFVLLIVVIAAYCAYWFIARAQIDKGIDEWIATERENGAIITYSDRQLNGFPYRFALTLEDPVYQAPSQIRWEGDELQLIMQPWNWNHVIARSPGRNLVTAEDGLRHTLTLDRKSVASLSWSQTAIRRFGLQLTDASALIDGQDFEVDNLSLNISPTPDNKNDLRIALQWDALTVPAEQTTLYYLGNTLQPSRLIAEIEGFYPALLAADGDIAQVPIMLRESGGAINLGQALINWGPMKFGAKGNIQSINQDWNGEISVRIDEGANLLEKMSAAGVPDDQLAAVSALDAMSQDGQFLTLKVQENTLYYLGKPILELPQSQSGS